MIGAELWLRKWFGKVEIDEYFLIVAVHNSRGKGFGNAVRSAHNCEEYEPVMALIARKRD